METELLITRNGYGFGHDWQMKCTLNGKMKVFYLGQDAKVCHRILGIRPSELVEQIGSNDMSLEETRQKICDLILEAINVNCMNEEKFMNLQEWEIAAE